MALVDFTSPDDIRAALGVSDDEIENVTISLPLYEDNLVVELSSIGSTLATLFATTKALPTPTDDQKLFLAVTRTFCTYVVARQLTTALPMFAPKQITDGKASIARFSESPFKETVKEVARQYEIYRARLVALYAALTAASAPPASPLPYMSVVSPSYDPITNV